MSAENRFIDADRDLVPLVGNHPLSDEQAAAMKMLNDNDKSNDWNACITLLDEQTNAKSGGLEPIINNGEIFIPILDQKRKEDSQDTGYLDMRVEAGMVHANALANACVGTDPEGKSIFAQAAAKELTTLLDLRPELVHDVFFQQSMESAQAMNNPAFKQKFGETVQKLEKK